MSEARLKNLHDALTPPSGVQARVRSHIMAATAAPSVFAKLSAQLTPTPDAHARVWSRVRESIEPVAVANVFDKLRDSLSATPLRESFFRQLAPVRVPASQRVFKWAAAFAVIAIVIRISPALFLQTIAPSTNANVVTKVHAVEGEVYYGSNGLWQPIVTEELELNEATMIKTGAGKATVSLPNYGNVRIPENSILHFPEVFAGLEPAETETVELLAGGMWVQGLLPEYLRGIKVKTRHGAVDVHRGSVSLVADDDGAYVRIRVFDGGTTAESGKREWILVEGEEMRLVSNGPSTPEQMGESAYDDNWVTENLSRDAVHRKEIAQWLHERRVANAVITRESPLYPIKRAAEALDLAMTFSEEEYAQKQIDSAQRRLDEASALIEEGSPEALTTLDEYRETLLAVASGSGGSALVRSILQEEVAADVAEVAVSLSTDDNFIIKKKVFEAAAALPESFVDQRGVEGALLLDTLAALETSLAEEDIQQATATFEELEPYLSELQSDERSLTPEVEKQAMASVTAIARDLMARAEEAGDVDPAVIERVEPFIPAPAEPETRPMTESQRSDIAWEIKKRVDVYASDWAKENQLRTELLGLQKYPDEDRASILRMLYQTLEPKMRAYVREEMGAMRQ